MALQLRSDYLVATTEETTMTITTTLTATAVIAAALLAGSGAAQADPRIDPPCSTLTVTIADRADIPSGVSVRQLQDALNYPDRCR